MLKNYLQTALRSLRRQKSYSLINVFGLSVGIMACLIIMLYVKSESSYESFYPDSEQIFRVTTNFTSNGKTNRIAVAPARVKAVSQANFPEVQEITYIFDWSVGRELTVKYDNNTFIEKDLYFADSSYFKVFQHDFLEGNPETALDQPNSIVMTESTSIKYFGRTTGVVGETLTANGDETQVTGVIREFQGNTSLKFDMILSMTSIGNPDSDNWFPMNFFTYVKTVNQEAANAYIKKLDAMVLSEAGEGLAAEGLKMEFYAQPLSDMHFETAMNSDYPEKVSINLIYSLSAIAVFILLIACINYINLSTAKSEKRAKEVGVRKVLGAYRAQLIWQFYGETFLITFGSVIIGVVLAELVLPFFNQLANTSLSLNLLKDPTLLMSLLGLVLIVSIISGSYPASFLSSFQPSKVLKSTFRPKGGNLFRRVLVTIQFCVSVFLLTGTLVIFYQLQFIQNKSVGYNQEELVYVNLSDGRSREAIPALKDAFSTITGVSNVTTTNNPISNVRAGWGSFMEGFPKSTNISFRGMNGDDDFVETMGFDLLAGETFSNRSDWESNFYYVINETGAEAYGFSPEEAVGKKFGLMENMMGTIVGVIKDFHLTSLHKEIEPLAVFVGPNNNYKNMMYLSVNMNRLDQIEADMDEVWTQMVPTRPLELNFVDESVRAHYDKDRRLGQIIISFTILAISIGCLGLFGLSSYLAEKRTKEIGIRKVLGADSNKIMMLLSKEYVRIVVISNLIGWPVAYYFMDQWLSGFAYRIEMNWMFFLASGFLTVLVAVITVSYQSLRAAVANPIKALRYE